jgi:glycosyl transferase family 25
MWGSYYTRPNCSVQGIFAINLDKSKNRWLALQKKAKEQGITVQRCPAVDGRELSQQEVRELGAAFWGIQDLTQKRKGEIGCFLSHRKLLYALSKLPYNDSTAYVILEDDIVFGPSFMKHLQDACMNVPEDWDMIFLGFGKPQWQGHTPNPLFSRLYHCQGAFGYIVRAKFIPTLLPYLAVFGEPIDTIYCRLMKVHNIYGLKQPIILHNYEGKSTIVEGVDQT